MSAVKGAETFWQRVMREFSLTWETYAPVRASEARKRTRNAFEIGYDAGEARLRDKIAEGQLSQGETKARPPG